VPDERVELRLCGRDEHVRRREPGRDGFAVAEPLRPGWRAMYRLVPGDDVRVADDHDRHAPQQRRVRVGVEVDELGVDLRGELEQPRAGTLDLVPRIIHPLERKRARMDAQVPRLACLLGRERGPHRRDRHLDVTLPERRRELERVRPDAADGVRAHQDAHGVLP
jgi:hypothetical protein